MKICLIGPKSSQPDEGMKTILACLRKILSRRHEVMTLSPNLSIQIGFWRSLTAFGPDIIHYIPGPSLLSFFLCRSIATVIPRVPVIMSATLPLLPDWASGMLRYIRPDQMLAQSNRVGDYFTRHGIPTRVLPISGVDTEKFSPLADITKRASLRKKYGIRVDAFVVLHVGHIKRKRNVQVMAKLSSMGIQPVIISGSSTGVDVRLCNELRHAGCVVKMQYTERIEEYYQLSDLYLFPVPPEQYSACIQIPLSVLEALSCNLPILTTSFGALAEIFTDTDGVWMVKAQEILERTKKLAKRRPLNSFHLRNIGGNFAWWRIAASLEILYAELRQK